MTRFEVDVLVPTFERPCALAVTLASLAGQTARPGRVVISDQSGRPAYERPEPAAVCRVLEELDVRVERHHHVPRRGIAEQRQFLLDRASAPYALFLDDDVVLEPTLLERLVRALQEAGCGFVGSAVVGLGHLGDERRAEEAIEFWDGPVRPEAVRPDGPGWERHRLHNAANLAHLRRRLGATLTGDRLYKVAWVGGCVLYDVAKLRAAGGFSFWRELPESHCGEDVLAQLRVMERYGGAGLFPSGAYHQELPTTLPDRAVDAPVALRAERAGGGRIGVG